ncbi:kinesin-like protein Klp8 [Chytriomyces hyalinus]|nr:kinesin-like protein Klp8 [Chytriomyces hyalinus]
MSSVKVFVRVRPLNSRERDCAVGVRGQSVWIESSSSLHSTSSTPTWIKDRDRDRDRERDKEKDKDRPFVHLPPAVAVPKSTPTATTSPPEEAESDRSFTFDAVFWSLGAPQSHPNWASQESVYAEVGVGLLNHALDGYNVCLFAYGQTGSGKSYTMMGPESQNDQDSKGIIPRICEDLFRRIAANGDKDKKFDISVSYMEIYNEKVRDLLNSASKSNLRVREHPTLGPYVEDLSRLVVTSYGQIEKLMELGNKARTVASTNMNETSSRSHAVFTVHVTQTITRAFPSVSPSQPNSVSPIKVAPSKVERISRICLVDLAGSERADSTGATGTRLKEGANINKSLTTLGKVISALAEASEMQALAAASLVSPMGSSYSSNGIIADIGGYEGASIRSVSKRTSLKNVKSGLERSSGVFVPYRDSVLTWLLKDCLGGNSKTVMLAAISPANTSQDETLSTLRYAERAKKIINRAVVNEDETGKVVRLLQEEVERLKKKLDTYEQLQQQRGLGNKDGKNGSGEADDVFYSSSELGFGSGGISSPAFNRSRGASLVSEDGRPSLSEMHRRTSFMSMNSIASGVSDMKDPEALMDQLLASEKLIAEMTESFESRLKKLKLVELQQDEQGADARPSSASFAVQAPKSIPHIINLTENPHLSDFLLYQLPEGFHIVGSSPECPIFLRDEAVFPVHARFECILLSNANTNFQKLTSSQSDSSATMTPFSSFAAYGPAPDTPSASVVMSVHLNPAPGSQTFVNGSFIAEPYRLQNGDHIQFGESVVCKFLNPTDAVSPQKNSLEHWSDLRSSVSGISGHSMNVSPRTSPTRSTPVGDLGEESRNFDLSGSARTSAIGGAAPWDNDYHTDRGYEQQIGVKIMDGVYRSQGGSESAFGSSKGRRSRATSAMVSIRPLGERELILAADVITKWKKRNYLQLAQEILKKAVLLKEANVIAKELEKNVLYEFEIVDSPANVTASSFWEASTETAFTSSNAALGTRSRQSSTPSPGALDISRPCLAIRVLDGKHNSVYKWSITEFESRLNSMRTLYDYPDPDAPSKYYAHQRAANSELSFYGKWGEDEKSARAAYPQYEQIGVAHLDIRCLSMGIMKELRAPVLDSDSGSIIGWVLVVIAPISAQPVHAEDSDPDCDSDVVNDLVSLSHDELKLGHSLVFEISILELTGVSENAFTQVHCQFRLSEFAGRVSAVDVTTGPAKDQIFSTDPVQGFGSNPIRWDFSQTIALTITEEAKTILSRGIGKIEVFARRVQPISDIIASKFDPRKALGTPTPTPQIAPPLQAQKDAKEHIILAQLEISELSQASGEFKSVPVQTGVSQSGTFKTEFRSPADVFSIRQGIQRRITLRLSHSAGKNDFPWRRISYLKIGQIRCVDLKTNRPLDDEVSCPVLTNLPVPGLDDTGASSSAPSENFLFGPIRPNRPFFSNNGQSAIEIVVPWDTSIHNCVHLNRPTKGFRLELTVAWGVEVDPLNNCNQPNDVSQWSVFASPVHFERQIGIIVHERDSKVRASVMAFDLLASLGMGSSKYASRSNSLFVVETFAVSSSLVPKVSKKRRSHMADIDTRNGYVRGQESLGGWTPAGQELVSKFWKRREKEKWMQELSFARSRIEEHDIFWRSSTASKLRSDQECVILLAKCVQLWRVNPSRYNPSLERLLYDQTPGGSNEDDGEEVNFVSTKCRLMLEMAPASFRGALHTPDVDDVWVKRHFVIRRPYLHMYADGYDLDELAIFSLVSTSLQFGSSLGVRRLHTRNLSRRDVMEYQTEDEYQFQLENYVLHSRKLPKAKLKWDKQRTLWKASVYKDVHPIFISHRREIPEEPEVYRFEGPPFPSAARNNKLPPLEPTESEENERAAILKYSMDMYGTKVDSGHAKHVNAEFFKRLAKPKCPGAPGDVSDRGPAKPIESFGPLVDRLSSQKPALKAIPIENDAHKQKAAPVNKAQIDRLAQAKVVRREHVADQPTKTSSDGGGRIERLSKPKYYIVWKNATNES